MLAVIMCLAAPKATTQDLYKNKINCVVKIIDVANRGEGSGTFIDDNIVMTAGHVVKDANFVYIVTSDGTLYVSEKIYFLPKNYGDIAFIYVKTSIREKQLVFADAVCGEMAFVIGNPIGIFPSFMTSYVSKLETTIIELNNNPLLQMDCGFIGGMSGAALFNSHGQIIGMTVGSSVGASGKEIGFCLPSKAILKYLKGYNRAVVTR
jgi:S1-C subfamily serine protease